MKITKSYLKKIIKEELSKTLEEDRQQHIVGLNKKIAQLRKAQDDITRSIANEEEAAQHSSEPFEVALMNVRSTNHYFAKQQEQGNLASKIVLLLKQLQQLQGAAAGKGNVGQLDRGPG